VFACKRVCVLLCVFVCVGVGGWQDACVRDGILVWECQVEESGRVGVLFSNLSARLTIISWLGLARTIHIRCIHGIFGR
jgi:hypothetical protein